MESLDDTFGPRLSLGSRRTRMAAGLVGLVVGVPLMALAVHRLVLGVVAAWIEPTAAAQTALALTAVFLPSAFALGVLRLPAARAVKLAAVGGVLAATLAVALYLITGSPGDARAGIVPPTVAFLYLAGCAVAVAAPLATMVATILTADDRQPPAHPQVPHEAGSQDLALPTDGGRQSDGLEFLLDDR